MKIAEINISTTGSTGKIMMGIAEVARAQGHEVKTFSSVNYSRNEKTVFPPIAGHKYLGNRFSSMLHWRFAQVTGIQGCLSFYGAAQLYREFDEFKPDVVHIHNIHDRTINVPLLFRYIKKHNIPTVWTLHDCWSFTGLCPHFELVKCNKWKTGCHHCPRYKERPSAFHTLVDQSKLMWKLKRRWFTGVGNMTIVTPSQWLAELAKQSYLKSYPVKVINNGIDLSIFKPTESNFREKHGIGQDKYILLGVAYGWGYCKGLDVFIELAKRLDDRFQIVLVGTDKETDKQLPCNIVSIHRTENQQQLAAIYTAADVFVIPTREENYPTVNMEALACGTPVITFKTGGSPEIIDEKTGISVEKDDVDAMEREIRNLCFKRPFSQEACINRSMGFDMNKRFEEYVKLYKDSTCSEIEL